MEIQFFNIRIHTVMRKPINLFESKYWKIHIPLVTTFRRIGGVNGEREAIASNLPQNSFSVWFLYYFVLP